MSNPEELVFKLTDSVGRVLRSLVNLAPWHEESVRDEAHQAVTDHVEALAELGRNLIPAGIVEHTEAPKNENTGTADSFPNPQE